MKLSHLVMAILACHWTAVAGPAPASALAGMDTPYAAGFRSELLHDETRGWGEPGVASPRPIRLYVWYPAERTAGTPMGFRRYVQLDHLAEPLSADDMRAAERRFREQFGARGWSSERLDQLLETRTRAFEGAEVADGRFPLVLFGNGLTARGFTYTTLCEYLAGHGYVVVTLPSNGAAPGEDPPFDHGGIELQLGDMTFALRQMRKWPAVDAQRLALAAWSVGGVTTTLLQMLDPEIDATVSLDSATSYAYGNELIRESVHFDPSRLDRPFLQMIGLEPSGFEVPRDDGFFSTLVSGPKYQLEFAAMQHGDFTSVPGDLGFHATDDGSKAESFRWIARYLERFLGAFLRDDATARAFLENEPSENGASSSLVAKSRGE